MHTLVSKLVALSVEKYYMALMEIQLKMCRFHDFPSQKGSRPLAYSIAHSAAQARNQWVAGGLLPSWKMC